MLKEFNFPNKLIKLIEANLKNMEINIKVASKVSGLAKVNTGLRQGDALLLILFNLILEKVIRDTNSNNEKSLGNSNINILAYADDIAIFRDTEEVVKRVCRKLMTMSGKVGLNLNDEKTEYTMISFQGRKCQAVKEENFEC